MRIRVPWLFVGMTLIWPCLAGAETIVAHETEKIFYGNGRMEKFEGQFENTYYLDFDKNTLIRTRVYDYQSKKITPDETVYHIEKTLRSDPSNAVRYNLQPVIRAVGHPDKDSVQTILIKEDEVETVTATADGFVLSRAKKLK